MEKLKAFVGHSFDDDDKPVVEIFLRYFDSSRETIGLEWEHAERAELKELSKKVKEKMEGKNLFIGIFTKKDYRIELHKTKNKFRRKKCFSEADSSWGTSDWIIQESGYALGKRMQLLFLVEKGVDISAGLQGDMEFIPFNRENPQLCFGKFNEMIGSILESKKGEPVPEGKMAPSADSEKREDKEDEKISEESPGRGWIRDYGSLYHSIVREKDFDKAETELDQIIKKYGDDKDHGEVYWRSRFHRLKCFAGASDGFVELQKLSEAYLDDPLPLTDLGYAYREYGNLQEAANQYLKALEREKNKTNKIDLIWKAAECHALDKNFPQAYNYLLAQFGDGELDNTQYHKLYTKLTEIAQMDEKDNLFTAFAEKALEYSPADVGTRFSLAFRYSEIDNNAAALYHYKILCDHNPNGGNLNNLGVAYKQLGMKYKSVYSYRKAADEYKATLAMANLAYTYIEEGFLSDAADILEKARNEKNYHNNVNSAMTLIHQTKETEEKSEKDILESLDRERKFRSNFAEAYALPFEVNIDGEWESEHGKISLRVEGEKIFGTSEISPPSALGVRSRASLVSNTLGLMAGAFTKRILRLEGKIYNRAIDYQLVVSIEYPSESTLAPTESTYEGDMYVAKDGSIIEVMERVKDKKKLRFYEMKRVQGSSNL